MLYSPTYYSHELWRLPILHYIIVNSSTINNYIALQRPLLSPICPVV